MFIVWDYSNISTEVWLSKRLTRFFFLSNYALLFDVEFSVLDSQREVEVAWRSSKAVGMFFPLSECADIVIVRSLVV